VLQGSIRVPGAWEAAIAVLVLAVATGAASAQQPPDRPPSEAIITDQPPPLVQGPPRKVRDLPCGIDGPALDLGDQSRYPSARGRLRAAMVFVDFSDDPAKAEDDPKEVYDRLVPGARRKLGELSYGKLKLAVKPSLRWVRMPKPHSAYEVDDYFARFAHYDEYVSDALKAAGKSFELKGYSFVFVIAGGRGYSAEAAYNRPPRTGVRVGRTWIDHAVTMNGYSYSTDWGTTIHETGHMLGLPDLYEVGAPTDWFRFVGGWDLMSDVYQSRPMMSWTRRLVGWLRDRDFRCVRTRSTVRLKPVTARKGTRGAIVRLGRRRAYVIEARTDPIGDFCPGEGVLIYKWNGNVKTGRGPIRVLDAQPGEGACGSHTQALFKPGEGGTSTYSDDRVDVRVLGGGPSGFRVRIRRR
jgi:M6 family metalloprotease-like protein